MCVLVGVRVEFFEPHPLTQGEHRHVACRNDSMDELSIVVLGSSETLLLLEVAGLDDLADSTEPCITSLV